ncbi:hypothetical protein [Pseudooceanicola sp. 200-1SW]|uniref:hypothetical protein n=1 Tax=Pseudooceanicola sp. 200-1SW TaxID=3425949 RepID=UPI003D7F91A8
MIARALELAVATSPGPHVLTAATFQRITDRLVSVAAPGTGAPEQVLGTLQLETGADRTSYELIEGDTIGVLPAWREIAEAR